MDPSKRKLMKKGGAKTAFSKKAFCKTGFFESVFSKGFFRKVFSKAERLWGSLEFGQASGKTIFLNGFPQKR